jgi:hypothetical protein
MLSPPCEGGGIAPAPADRLSARLPRDPLAVVAVTAAPIVLEARYRLLLGALWRLRRSRRGRWVLAAGSGALVVALGLLAARCPNKAGSRRQPRTASSLGSPKAPAPDRPAAKD